MTLEQIKQLRFLKRVEDLRKQGEIRVEATPLLVVVQAVKELLKHHKAARD